MTERIVIVGGGLAAATAAKELRKRGFAGAIDLIAEEAHRPYKRPPLSKEYLTGDGDLAKVFVGPDGWEEKNEVTLHLGTRAESIADGTIMLSDGSMLHFDRLLIATGSLPRTLDVPGAAAPNVHTFRTLDDSEQLRAALAAGGKHVVCIGAGWIGLELAAAARGYDNEVTVLSRGGTPLANVLGEQMGKLFQQVHEEHGVRFLLNRTIESIDDASGAPAQSNPVASVRTDHEAVEADLVIVGVGATPEVSLAESAGTAIDHGILVNERLESSVPHIYAAGDVAHPMHPVLGERLRTEHWAFALASGKVAASSMLDGDAVLDDIPYFYTDQYDLGMEYSGYGPLMRDAELVVRGDLKSRKFIAFWLAEGVVVAGMNVNVWKVNDEIQRLIRDRVPVTIEQLRDPEIELSRIA